jgi:hypothetical protein
VEAGDSKKDNFVDCFLRLGRVARIAPDFLNGLLGGAPGVSGGWGCSTGLI